MDPLGVRSADRHFGAVFDSRISAQAAAGGLARIPAQEFRSGMCIDRTIWRGDLRTGYVASTLLPGTHGVHGPAGGMGGESARHWGHSGYADHRIHDGEDR